jgi:hypothetical protein
LPAMLTPTNTTPMATVQMRAGALAYINPKTVSIKIATFNATMLSPSSFLDFFQVRQYMTKIDFNAREKLSTDSVGNSVIKLYKTNLNHIK